MHVKAKHLYMPTIHCNMTTSQFIHLPLQSFSLSVKFPNENLLIERSSRPRTTLELHRCQDETHLRIFHFDVFFRYEF